VLQPKAERDKITLLCRCNAENTAFHDLHVLPRVKRGRSLLTEKDSYLRAGKPLKDLAALSRIARSMYKPSRGSRNPA
jgi:hypothetical protein